MRNADQLLPPPVRAMSRSRWRAPTEARVKATFFAPGSQSVKDYAIARGAPSNGVFAINDKRKPDFHIWLSDLKDRRSLLDFFNHERSFAKMHKKQVATVHGRCDAYDEHDALTKAPTEWCENYAGQGPSRPRVVMTNYKQDAAYYYPVCTNVDRPTQYYPWARYREIAEGTRNFDTAWVYYRYSNRKDWHPKPK